MTNLETLKNSMQSNGYAYFDRNAFLNKTTNVCYIPENAETIEECYTYLDLQKLVEDWAKENKDYMQHHKTSVSEVLNEMYDNLEWTFPETYLNELIS